jgi:uncharacterized LabA/DUF88 family protein
MNNHANSVRQSVGDIIGSNTFLKLKRKTEDDLQREQFESIILLLEEIEVRSIILSNDLKIDLASYDEKFYMLIEKLLNIHFGDEANEIIFYYIYDRINPDGSVNELRDEKDNVVLLTSPSDLWDVVKLIQSKGKRKK